MKASAPSSEQTGLCKRRVGHPKFAETILNLSFFVGVGVPHPFVFGF